MLTGKESDITADTITIDDLLSGNRRLSIPAYQRPYDWGKDEAEDFLDDLKSSIDGNFKPFFGTIVVDTSNDIYEIIDGQQRITTFNLFLIALRTILIRNATTEDVRLAQKIHSVLCYENKTSGKSEDVISRLVPSISINDAYLPIAKNQDWDGLTYPTGPIKLKIRKIQPILEYFLDELSSLKHDEISILLDSLYSGYVIILKITNKTQALEIFEHANVRGMELNAGDLLKSYFVSSIDDQKDSELENRWIEIVENTSNVIRMIKHFGWTLFKKELVANRNKFYAELKARGVKDGSKVLLDKFDQFAQAYGIIESGEEENLIAWSEKNGLEELAGEQRAITMIRSLMGIRLFRVTQTYPLLAAALVSYKEKPSSAAANAVLDLADTLEKYHYINSFICQRRGNEVENIYAGKAKEITSGEKDLPQYINELKNVLKNQVADFEKEFAPKFKDISYDPSPQTLKSLYYTFDRIENIGRKGREIESIFNPKLAIVKGDWEVEHILPLRPTTAYAFENSNDVINGIGNLLVVPSGTNKAVGNKPIKEKISIYKEKIGKLQSVMVFCASFNEGKFGDFNSRDEVEARSTELAKLAYGKVFAITKEQERVLK